MRKGRGKKERKDERRGRKEEKKGEKKEKKGKRGDREVKKFACRHTLKIYSGKENSTNHFRGGGGRNQTLVRIYFPAWV